MTAERPTDHNHAWLVGLFVAAAMRMGAEHGNGWSINLVDDPHGWPVNTFRMEHCEGAYEVSIKKLDDPTDVEMRDSLLAMRTSLQREI